MSSRSRPRIQDLPPVLRELLQRNLGRGFFSLDQFGEAPVVDTDASKSQEVATLRAAGATDSFATVRPRSAT